MEHNNFYSSSTNREVKKCAAYALCKKKFGINSIWKRYGKRPQSMLN